MNRRRFLKRTLLLGAGATAVGLTDAIAIEPERIEVTRPRVPSLGLGATLVHLTDIHYHGNRALLERIVRLTNAERPDLVCVTGDLIDRRRRKYLPEALELLAGIRAPLFGVPGNHDPRDDASTTLCRRAFARSGGAWLTEERLPYQGIVLHGTYETHGLPFRESRPTLLLCHFPVVGDDPRARRYDLVLAGHSHGGQCRLPFLPPLILPNKVGRYVEGFFPDAPVGPLYVSRGLGSSLIPLRFCCRPELAVMRV